MKWCKGCEQTKPFEEFHKNSCGKFGLSTNCKICVRLKTAKWVAANPERHKANSIRRNKMMRPGTESERVKHWVENNRERSREIKANWKKRNPIHTLSPSIRNHCSMSTRMRKLIKFNKAGRSWQKITGYDVHTLKFYLESLFQPGMSWENYGEWHIDHIRPVSSYDFSVEPLKVAAECWALENLQPLWAIDNMRKGNKYAVHS